MGSNPAIRTVDEYTWERYFIENDHDERVGPYIVNSTPEKLFKYALAADREFPEKAPHCVVKETIIHEWFYPDRKYCFDDSVYDEWMKVAFKYGAFSKETP